MKTVKINFINYLPDDGTAETHIITKLLRKHYNVEFSDEPDYLFYSMWGPDHLKTEYRGCVKICIMDEARVPDFNFCDYAISYEYLTYRDRHLQQSPAALLYTDPRLYDRGSRSAKAEARSRFCSFVYSHATDATLDSATLRREKILEALDAYKPVDCGGGYRHNIDIPPVVGLGSPENELIREIYEYHPTLCRRMIEKVEFDKNYRFSIACENSSSPGYRTEKIVNAFQAGTIPIYYGDPCIKDVFNEKAFVCASDYPDDAALVRRVREIDENDALYEEMIRQPVFAAGYDPFGERQRLEDYLLYIFEQDKPIAYRRLREWLGPKGEQEAYEYALGYQRWQKLTHLAGMQPVKKVWNGWLKLRGRQ